MTCGGLATGGGEVVGGARPLTQLDERIGLALRHGAGVGHAVGGGAEHGELLDQRAHQGAVHRVQPALQAQASVAAVAQPQLAAGPRRGRGVVGGLGPVRIQVSEDAVGDSAKPAGIEVTGVAGQIRLDALAHRLRDRGGRRPHGLGDHP